MNAWHEQLEMAKSVPEVVILTRDYLATLAPYDLAPIPADCRPHHIRDASDIDFWNLRLAEQCRSVWGTEVDGRVLHEIANFFLRASVKVSHISEESTEAHHD